MPRYSLYTNPFSSHTKVVNIIGRGKKVLEIGCSTGYVSKRLKENNCIVSGIEIDAGAAEKAKNYCDHVLLADIETTNQFPYKLNNFDVILFGDVLEHIRYPSEVLIKFKKFLKKDGFIVVSIPNIAYWSIRLKLLLGEFEYTDHGILDSTHVKFFNYKTAKRLMKDSGLRIIRTDFIPPVFPVNITKLTYLFSKIFPNLFAFQFIFVAVIED